MTDPKLFVFQVFLIPGASSRAACAALRRMCGERLGESGWEIQEVDLLENPALAAEHRILAIPTVVRLAPVPTVRLVGDLANEDLAAQAFELPDRADKATSR